MNLAAAVLILALIPPPVVSTAGPTGSPSPAAGSSLHVIATVKSNPYCTSMVDHFNGALRPMIANDYALDRVDDQLIDLKDVWNGPNFVQKFTTVRVKLLALVGAMQKRLPVLQDEVNKLRQGEALTKDPLEAHKNHQLAEKMQLAYNKQFQLTNDLLALGQNMMQYDQFEGDHPLGGQDSETLSMPDDMKDMKSYLKFDGQRDVIRSAESDAGDIAYDIATTNCSK